MVTEDKSTSQSKYIIELLDEKLTITGNISEKVVNKLRDLVNSIGEEISGAYPQIPRRRLWGLTLINLAYKYYKLSSRVNSLLQSNKNLKSDNNKLEQELKSVKTEYREISKLLEEVDS